MKLLDNNLTKSQWIAVLLSLVFVIINSIFIANEFFYLSLIPAILLIGLMYFTVPDKILILIAFLTPLAVNLSSFDMDIGVSLPTEPLLAALLLLILAKILFDRNFDKRVFIHPISMAFYLYFIWMIITVFTSEYPLVSLKSMIAKLWFIIPIYFFGILVFKNPQKILYFVYAYIGGFIIVIIYTMIHHYMFGFSSESAHWVMSPFYNDHTSYGALLAMFIPFLTGILFDKSLIPSIRWIIFGILILFLVAIILSVSRAAWASVLVAFGVWVLIYFKIKFKWIFSLSVIFIVLVFSFKNQIVMKMERNKQDAKGGLVQHVESVSNVATDASNLERLNRWGSAIRMFNKRPIFGWGPGTYQFVYAPFQKSYEKTVISTNVGNRGTAHSEYLLILSEEGLLGGLSFLLIIILIIITALANNKHISEPKVRLINLLLFLGLITYMAHAVFNNFLDTDKAAVPFWGFVAGIVSISIYQKTQPEKSLQK